MNAAGAPLGTDTNWLVPQMSFDRMYISEFRQMTPGTWQPVLYYNTQ